MNVANDNLDELRRAEKTFIEAAKLLQARLDEMRSNLERLSEISDRRQDAPDPRWAPNEDVGAHETSLCLSGFSPADTVLSIPRSSSAPVRHHRSGAFDVRAAGTLSSSHTPSTIRMSRSTTPSSNAIAS